MFSIHGFLTCKSKFPDELQTPQPNWKISDCQPCESPMPCDGVSQDFATAFQSCAPVAVELGYGLGLRHRFVSFFVRMRPWIL